jgi:hypothetical protein
MTEKKGIPVLIPFLALVSVLFIGVLIWVYVETKKANPQMIKVGSLWHDRSVAASRGGHAAGILLAHSRRPSPHASAAHSRRTLHLRRPRHGTQHRTITILPDRKGAAELAWRHTRRPYLSLVSSR